VIRARNDESPYLSSETMILIMFSSSELALRLVCPLCSRFPEPCSLCGVEICPEHDVVFRIASEAICGTCWRTQ